MTIPLCPICNQPRKKAKHTSGITTLDGGYYKTCGKKSCVSAILGHGWTIPKVKSGKKVRLSYGSTTYNKGLKNKTTCPECGQPKTIGKMLCDRCGKGQKVFRGNDEKRKRATSLFLQGRKKEKKSSIQAFDEMVRENKALLEKGRLYP